MEREERGAWERSRFVAFALLQPNLKKGTSLKATDLVTFPWEKKKKPKLSKEELRKKLEERDLL